MCSSDLQETEKVAEQKKNFKQVLNIAKQDLAGGKMRDALSSYNRARKPMGQQADYDDSNDLQQIAKDVKGAQSRNLIIAQNNFAVDNAARCGDQLLLQQPVQQQQQKLAPAQQQGQVFQAGLNGDIEVAGQQWEKLEAAQRVTAPKVSPLRVNLPTRGIRYAFTQVLQTELHKPVTIQLYAENTRLPSWGQRLGLFGLGFVVLWLLMTLVVRWSRAAERSI